MKIYLAGSVWLQGCESYFQEVECFYAEVLVHLLIFSVRTFVSVPLKLLRCSTLREIGSHIKPSKVLILTFAFVWLIVSLTTTSLPKSDWRAGTQDVSPGRLPWNRASKRSNASPRLQRRKRVLTGSLLYLTEGVALPEPPAPHYVIIAFSSGFNQTKSRSTERKSKGHSFGAYRTCKYSQHGCIWRTGDSALTMS